MSDPGKSENNDVADTSAVTLSAPLAPSKANQKKSMKGKAATNLDSNMEARQEAVVKKANPKKPVIRDEGEEEGKKQPMRQATDVISRILWDPDLPSEEFTVGYLDRFVGIIEKPFSAFSWEDIASVGASVLAVPKHRIQYFKYRNEIVWDKRCQLDNFFGSRGGKVIQEVLREYKADGSVATTEATNVAPAAGEEEDENETIALESEDTTAPTAFADKNRPTHFVCIHVTSEEVKSNVQKIQNHITSHTPQLIDGCLPVSALHVTLCMVRLETDQQIETAQQVMENARRQFIHILPRCVQATFSGVDHFRQRLVYVRVVPNPAMERFVFFLLDQFQQAGVKTPGNRDQFTPHMTIVKLSRPLQRELHTTLISPASYLPFQNMSVGRQHIDTLHLCSMTEQKQSDGFYLRVGRGITNSLSGLPPAFSSLLQKRLEYLAKEGVITDSERDQLTQSVQAYHDSDSTNFDAAINELLRLNSEETMCSKAIADNHPSVIIVRGLPGSGKSFLARNCSEMLKCPSQVAICGADDYFMEGDSYRFNPDLVPKAHTYCLSQFLEALTNGKELIVVDNTNSKLWEYQIYSYICEILGYDCYILEVPCPSTTLAEMFRSRNVHNIDSSVAMKIFHRWEQDERATTVPPTLAYPRMRPTSPPEFSLLSLCQQGSSTVETFASFSSITAVYAGIFLSNESQWQLVSRFMPTHHTIYASHVTLKFEPSSKALLQAKIGRKVTLRVSGSIDNGKIQAVVVELPRGVQCENETPHITISTEEGISPKRANAMLKNNLVKTANVSQPIYLEGVVGVMVRETNEHEISQEADVDFNEKSNKPFFVVTSNTDFHFILPKLFQNAATKDTEVELQVSPIDYSDTQICTGFQKVTQLFVFDFDDTLFHPPEPKEGRELYEKYTGKKWPHKGWLGWPESLLPPTKIHNGPALPEFRQHLSRAGSLTLILTGRIERTEKGILSVLEGAQVYPQRLVLKPNSTNETTPTFKTRIIRELLEEFPDVTLVKFWDDNYNNLAAIHRLSKTTNVQFEIIDVTKMQPLSAASKQGKKSSVVMQPSPPRCGNSALEVYLTTCGLLPDAAYTSAAISGIEFLASQFAKVIGFTGNPMLLAYPFGSFPLGRQSDVDLCFLAPPRFTANDCMENLARQLGDCGLNYIHVGHSSRCPRLKAMLEFSNTPVINYDIVFAVIGKEEIFSSPPGSQLHPSKLASLLKPGDSTSKVALTGLQFLQQVQDIITGTVSKQQFGAVVEMVLQVLIAHRQKGNAYHCIRTFHVVQLLADFIKSHEAHTSSSPNCDTLFREFVTHVSALPEMKWQKLFGEFVPIEFIPKVIKAFSAAAREASHDDFPSFTCYEEMMYRAPFPPEGYIPIALVLSGTKDTLLWKLHTVAEARLPSYTRQLMTMGLDVIPDGNVRNERKFCFSVPHTKSCKQTLQQVLRPLWSELAEFRKQSGVTMELNFGSAVDAASNQDTPTGTNGALIERIMQFHSQSSNELHLPASLSSYERLLVHETAERLGHRHTTVGSGKDKHIVLQKK